MMHLLNQQVGEMDDMIQKILSTSEKDFLLAYRVSSSIYHLFSCGLQNGAYALSELQDLFTLETNLILGFPLTIFEK